jgi:hypothetical protein
VLSKVGEAYARLATKILAVEKTSKSLERAQKDFEKVSAHIADTNNPRYAESFLRLARAQDRAAAAAAALEREQNKDKSQAISGIDQLSDKIRGLGTSMSSVSPSIGGLITKLAEIPSSLSGIGTMAASALGPVGVAVAAVGSATALAIGPLSQMADEFADAGDHAQDLAERTGVGTGFLTTLGGVAQTAGSNMEGVSDALVKLARNAQEDSEKFSQWGVSVEDANGKTKSAEQLFYDAADAIAKIKSPIEQAAAAQDLFGKGSEKIVPMIRGGSAALRESQLEFARWGGIITAEGAQAASKYKDSLLELETRLGLFSRTAGQWFLGVKRFFVEWANNILREVVDLYRAPLASLQQALVNIQTVFANVAHSMHLIDDAKHAEVVIGLAEKYDSLQAAVNAAGNAAQNANEAIMAPEATAEHAKSLTEHRRGLADLARLQRERERQESDAADRRRKREEQEEQEEQERRRRALVALKAQEDYAKKIDDLRDFRAKAAETAEREREQVAQVRAQERDKKIQAEKARQKKQADDAAHLTESIATKIADLSVNLVSAVTQGADAFKNTLENMANQIALFLAKSAIQAFIRFLAGAATGGASEVLGGGGILGSIFGSIFGATGGRVGSLERGVRPLLAASGGRIRGGVPGRDTVPVLAQQDEVILPTSLVAGLEAVLGGVPRSSAPAASGGTGTAINVTMTSAIPTTHAEMDRFVLRSLMPSLRRLRAVGIVI